MSKATLEFDLKEEREEFVLHLEGPRLAVAVTEYLQYLRAHATHSETKPANWGRVYADACAYLGVEGK